MLAYQSALCPSFLVILRLSFSAPGTPPRNIRARAASSSTIVVSWEEPEIKNGIIQVSQAQSSLS